MQSQTHPRADTLHYKEAQSDSPCPRPGALPLYHHHCRHCYKLSHGRYKVLIDGREEAGGKLLSAKFQPPLQPPETIPDPDHVKPEDWVEEEMWVVGVWRASCVTQLWTGFMGSPA